MKILNILQINSEKVLNNMELLTLRGGYGDCHCMCRDAWGRPMGLMAASNQADCHEFCGEMGWDGEYNCLW
jgi:hypothetical protein